MPTVPMKCCARCRNEFPATAEYFYKHTHHPDGLGSYCKRCECERQRVAKAPEEFVPQGMKRCPRCRQVFPRTTEFFHKHGKLGLNPICKTCRNARCRQLVDPVKHNARTSKYNKEHPEVARRAQKKWHERHPDYRIPNATEKNRMKMREWRRANPEKSHAAYQRYHDKYREQEQARHRVYVKANRAKYAAIARNRRARVKQADGSHTAADVQRQYKAQKGRCYWCGVTVGDTYHVDHVIPISRGGSNGPDNLVIACIHCNETKKDKLPHEWNGNNGKLL